MKCENSDSIARIFLFSCILFILVEIVISILLYVKLISNIVSLSEYQIFIIMLKENQMNFNKYL